jgi:hypothetical protein
MKLMNSLMSRFLSSPCLPVGGKMGEEVREEMVLSQYLCILALPDNRNLY